MMLLNYFKHIFQSLSIVNNSLLNSRMENSNTKSPFRHGSLTNKNFLMKNLSLVRKTSNDNLIKKCNTTNSKKLNQNPGHFKIGSLVTSEYSDTNEGDIKRIWKSSLFSDLKQKSTFKENNLNLRNLNVENSNFKDNLGKLSKLELKDKMMNLDTSSVKVGLGKVSPLNMKEKLISKGVGNANPLKGSLGKISNSGLTDNLSMKKPKSMKGSLEKVSSLDMKEKMLSKGKDNLTKISKSELKEKIKRSETNKSKNESSVKTAGRDSINTNDTAFQLSAFKDLDESNEMVSEDRIGFDNDLPSTKPLLTFTSSSESIVSDVVGKPPKKLKKVSKKGSLEKELIEDFQNTRRSIADSSVVDSSDSTNLNTTESSESSLEESSDEYSLREESGVLTESVAENTATSKKLKTLTGKQTETNEKMNNPDNSNKEKIKGNKGKSKKSESKENVIKQSEDNLDKSDLKKEATGEKSKNAIERESRPRPSIDNAEIVDKLQFKKEVIGEKSESSAEKESKSKEWLDNSDMLGNKSGTKTKAAGGKPKQSTSKINMDNSVIPKPPTGKLAKSPKNEMISKDKESTIIQQNSELKGKSEKTKNKVSKMEKNLFKKDDKPINESSSEDISIEPEINNEKTKKGQMKKKKNKDIAGNDDKSELINENEKKNKSVKDEGITVKTKTKSKTTQKDRISGSISTDNSVALPTSNLSKSERKSKVENSKTSKDKSETENNLTLTVPQISKGNLDDPGLFAENKQYNEITDVIPNRMQELKDLNVASHCRVCESIFDSCCNCGCLMDSNRFPIFPSLKNNEMCRKICYKPLKKCQSMTVCRPIPSVNCKEMSRYSSSCSDSLSLTYNCITDDSMCTCVCPQRVICISR